MTQVDQPKITLSFRQLQCLQGAAVGDTDAEIGARLYLGTTTIRRYMDDLREKLGARNRAHAVHLGHLAGLLGGEGS